MASLRRFKKSQYWFACITLPNGKQKQFSTKLTDREAALDVARMAEMNFRRNANNNARLRESLARLADEHVPPTIDVTPGAWLEAWAVARGPEVSPATLATYKNTMREASRWMEDHGIKRFNQIDRDAIVAMRNEWAERSSPVTANSKLKHLRVALNAAVVAKLLEESPAATVPPATTKKTARRSFTDDEIQRLLPHLDGEWLALFYLGLFTGQRLNDLSVLTWSAVDLERGTICFTAAKTDALVALPLLPPALDVLRALPRTQLMIFPGIAARSTAARSNQFRVHLAKAGLARPLKQSSGTKRGKRETSELSFHSLRHTTTSILKSAGVADSIARAIIGHNSVEISRQYTHLDEHTMRAALEQAFGVSATRRTPAPPPPTSEPRLRAP